MNIETERDREYLSEGELIREKRIAVVGIGGAGCSNERTGSAGLHFHLCEELFSGGSLRGTSRCSDR